jgi:hypothetical protein
MARDCRGKYLEGMTVLFINYHRVLTSLRKLQNVNSNFHLTTKTLQTKPKNIPKLVIIFAVVGKQNFQFIQQRK